MLWQPLGTTNKDWSSGAATLVNPKSSRGLSTNSVHTLSCGWTPPILVPSPGPSCPLRRPQSRIDILLLMRLTPDFFIFLFRILCFRRRILFGFDINQLFSCLFSLCPVCRPLLFLRFFGTFAPFAPLEERSVLWSEGHSAQLGEGQFQDGPLYKTWE